MATKNTSKNSTVKKKVVQRKVSKPSEHTSVSFFNQPFRKLKQRIRGLLSRRPHRSFRRTKRRDYVRSLQLSGYLAFTSYVRETLWRNRKLFLLLAITYGVLTAVFVGFASQENYSTISDTLRTTSTDIFKGNVGEIGKAGLLVLTGATGSFNAALTETQQIYAVILGLLAWLTTVWLLRGLLAGQKPRLRDGLYNSGAPLISTFLVFLVLIIQLLPMALAAIVFSAAISSGFIEGGVEAMTLSVGVILLVTLSIYWITSTIIGLVIVTLPGMYPMQAIKTAGDLVIGRRLRILLRQLWLLLTIAIGWIIIMVPVILFDSWIKSIWSTIEWIPLVPLALLILSSFTLVWSASYIYLLYRKIVEDDTQPV